VRKGKEIESIKICLKQNQNLGDKGQTQEDRDEYILVSERGDGL
jgi:hypothetical protein